MDSKIKNQYLEFAEDNLKYFNEDYKTKKKIIIQEPFRIMSKSGTVSDLGMKDKEITIEDNIWKVDDLAKNFDKILKPELETIINGIIYNCNVLYDKIEEETGILKNNIFTVSNSVDDVSKHVNDLLKRVTSIENDVKSIKSNIKTLESNVKEALNKVPKSSGGYTLDDLQDIVNNLMSRVKILEGKI